MTTSSGLRYLIGILAAGTAFAAAPTSAAPLSVTSVQAQADGVLLRMRPGVMKIQVCAERIVHVVYSPTDTLPSRRSFVILKHWAPMPFRVSQGADAVAVRTAALQVRVRRATGAVTFLDAAGRVLLREPADGGKTMTPALVNQENSYAPEQTFLCPADESLFGMGQYQEGLWDWRGIPLQLRQQNTQVCVPMLVSSKGYGLLWDNASLTDFNPPGPQVALDPTTHAGTFTTGAAGEYTFAVRDGNRSREIGLSLDGQTLADISNMWVPYAISAKASLPAGHVCKVQVMGGGPSVKLYARTLGDTTTFRSEVGDAIDYTFFYGPKWDDVIRGYREATGQAPLWPKWAYGFWQCRERYNTQQETLDAAAGYRQRRIPVDLIVQDWQYWKPGQWGAYDWDTARYPDPAAMIRQLHDTHVKYMISVWSNPSGAVHDALQAVDGLLPGTPWEDMYRPQARAVRWDYMDKAFFSLGTDAWWQDATEPGDDGNSVEDRETFLGSGNRVRNAYPLFASLATYEGQRATDPAKRVVNLTRSAYLGQQRYGAATWSGDIGGDWLTLRRQIPAGLNFCLTGIPYWTTDTGGFFRPRDQFQSADYNELLTRWFEWSTFCPILRIHGYQTATELWKWPLAVANLTAYDKLRYRMLPYNYSVAWQVTHDGYTQMRALPLDFGADRAVYKISDQYMFGPAFLVSPVTTPGATSRKVYLPAGTVWHDFWTGGTLKGGQTVSAAAPLDRIPLFVRSGSLVPLGPEEQYATEKAAAPLELRVYPGADGDFTLYEDTGDGYDYEKGARAVIPIHWDDAHQTLTLGARRGTFPRMPARRTFLVVRVRPGVGVGPQTVTHPDSTVHYDGQQIAVKLP